jgi:type IV secretion system protein VirB4
MIREALRQYDLGGLMGNLLSAKTDGLTLARFNCFEMEHLMQLGPQWSLPVLDYLFRRVELANKGQPSFLIIDEAWLMLSHPAFSAKIRDWLKVFRTANCAVVLATQNVMDLANSPLFSDIIESTASKIFLANPNARNEEVASVYRRTGLNNSQIGLISRAVPKRDYFHFTDEGSRLFSLVPGPVQTAFFGASDKDSLARIRRLEELYGNQWPQQWLNERSRVQLNDYLNA